jgi:hypothetical protein
MSAPVRNRTASAPLLTGGLLVALAALVRPEVVGHARAAGGPPAETGVLLLIQGGQVVALLLGLLCLFRRRVPLLPPSAVGLANLALLACVLIATWANLRGPWTG